jgi:hypothetical protein
VSDDPVAEACGQLAEYIATLETLVAEPAAEGATPAARSRAAYVPEPYGQAGRALMTAWEGVPRLEAWLKLILAGHPGLRRGGSPGNIAAALRAIPRLTAGTGDDETGMVIRYLDKLINDARSVHGIDENRRWRHLRGRETEPGSGRRYLPPRCPYCKTYNLLADPEAKLIACPNPGCPGDKNGDPPLASMGTGQDGHPQLEWADGRIDPAPDLEDPPMTTANGDH